MALPTQTNIVTIDYPFRGLPMLTIPAKSGIVTETMDYPSRGLPIVVNGFGAVAAVTANAIFFGHNF